jgi:hypothetical protein
MGHKKPTPIPPVMERPPGLPTSPPPPRVKERPILFSGPMVRAILEGRKTQTRRIIKPQPTVIAGDKIMHIPYDQPGKIILCPYGERGDRLWVRESFSTDTRDPLNCVIYKATPEYGKYRDTGELVRSSFPDGSLPTREESARAMLPKFWKGKPSIHMPRWASRITLEITGVRVERLQDITEADAIAEGYSVENEIDGDPIEWFAYLWESINGAGSWAANPWVWVVEFRRCEQ